MKLKKFGWDRHHFNCKYTSHYCL